MGFAFFRLSIISGLIISLLSCDNNTDNVVFDLEDRVEDNVIVTQLYRDRDTLYFGFDLRASPVEDSRQYLPFLKYLGQATGYRFELRFTSKDKLIVEELGQNRIQFAAIGAVSYIEGQEKYNIHSVVRGLNIFDKAEYKSMIVVASASNINKVTELKGKRFAFGSRSSTQGYLIPRIIMQKHNMDLNSFSVYQFMGSHKNCANAVVSGNYDACGLQDTLALSMADQGLLKILYSSAYYPSSGIAANQKVDPKILSQVKKALLAFRPNGKHRNGLYHWDETEMPNGFVESHDSDYDELRKWRSKFGVTIENAGGK